MDYVDDFDHAYIDWKGLLCLGVLVVLILIVVGKIAISEIIQLQKKRNKISMKKSDNEEWEKITLKL